MLRSLVRALFVQMFLLVSCLIGLCLAVDGGWSSSGQVMSVLKDTSLSGGTVLMQSVAYTKDDCVLLCLSHAQCATVSFHHQPKSCVIYDDYLTDQAVSYRRGWSLIGVRVKAPYMASTALPSTQKFTTEATTVEGTALTPSPCTQFTLYSRTDWGAEARSYNAPAPNLPVSVLVVHSTGEKGNGEWAEDCGTLAQCLQTMRDMQQYDKYVREYVDISANFYIDGSGRVYEGRGWDINATSTSSDTSDHAPNYDVEKHVAVTLFGDFKTEVPTAPALSTLLNFVECAVQDGKMTSPYTVLDNEDYSSDCECSGDASVSWLHNWPNIIP